MAEGLLRDFGGGRFEAFSAGTEATMVRPLAIRAMHELGIDISGQQSKTLERYLDEPFDTVITVCDQANETCTLVHARLALTAARRPAPGHASGALERADDVFFLNRGELDQPATDLRATVRRRRAEWQRQRLLVAPLELGHPPRLLKALLSGAATVVRRTDVTRDVLIGQGASPGRATGRVRIVSSVADFDAFEPGEVLVARATAPAWTPLFVRAAAVVTDGGTLAAHASLVAREYGIPAVVGTSDATRRLRTGQLVTVDGTAGTVEIVDG
jgi:phosphohistidine swiveling domain-containing protein/protein-tyrosine-phosphatase